MRFKRNRIELLKDCMFIELKDAQLVADPVANVRCPRRSNSTLFFKTACQIHCSDRNVMLALGDNNRQADSSVLGLPQFWMFFIFLALSWMGMAVVVSLGDAICFHMLGMY